MPEQYILPYTISNAIAVSLLWLAFRRPNVSRWCIALIFAYASVFNSYIGIVRPERYQGFAELAVLEVYREFIRGFFRGHATIMLLIIAAGQAVIALTMALGGRLLWIGVLGTCIFLTAIIPLWVGSAFPFSLIVSAAAILLQRKLAAPI